MKAFIISLSKIPESLSTATEMIPYLQENGFDVELFEGTYGNDAILMAETEGRTLHPTLHNGKLTKQRSKLCNPGVLGCFYSHYRLWQKCVEFDEPIFIFEDDVTFVRPFHNVDFQEVLIVAVGSWKKVSKIDIMKETIIEPQALMFDGPCLPGAVGYGITPAAAQKLVTEFQHTFIAADAAVRSSIVTIERHSHIIGRALVEEDGKVSLTQCKEWINI